MANRASPRGVKLEKATWGGSSRPGPVPTSAVGDRDAAGAGADAAEPQSSGPDAPIATGRARAVASRGSERPERRDSRGSRGSRGKRRKRGSAPLRSAVGKTRLDLPEYQGSDFPPPIGETGRTRIFGQQEAQQLPVARGGIARLRESPIAQVAYRNPYGAPASARRGRPMSARTARSPKGGVGGRARDDARRPTSARSAAARPTGDVVVIQGRRSGGSPRRGYRTSNATPRSAGARTAQRRRPEEVRPVLTIIDDADNASDSLDAALARLGFSREDVARDPELRRLGAELLQAEKEMMLMREYIARDDKQFSAYTDFAHRMKQLRAAWEQDKEAAESQISQEQMTREFEELIERRRQLRAATEARAEMHEREPVPESGRSSPQRTPRPSVEVRDASVEANASHKGGSPKARTRKRRPRTSGRARARSPGRRPKAAATAGAADTPTVGAEEAHYPGDMTWEEYSRNFEKEMLGATQLLAKADEEDRAARVIQAHARGMRARHEVQSQFPRVFGPLGSRSRKMQRKRAQGQPDQTESAHDAEVRRRRERQIEEQRRQREARRAHEARIAEATKADREKAATSLQAVYRGRQGRERARNELAVRKMVKERREREAAAVRIQATARGKLGRRRADLRREYREVEAAQAARVARLKAAHDAEVEANLQRLKQHKAAVGVQRIARGHSARRLVDSKKREVHESLAAVQIQRVARGHATRRNIAKIEEDEDREDAAIHLQAIARGNAARARVAHMRRVEAALAEKRTRSACAVKIQAVARGRRDRKVVARRLKEIEEAAAQAFIRSAARLRRNRAALSTAFTAFLPNKRLARESSNDGLLTPASPKLIEEARKNLKALPEQAFRDLAAVSDPPLPLAGMAGAVCILLGVKPTWGNLVTMMQEGTLVPKMVKQNPFKLPRRRVLVAGKVVRDHDIVTIASDTSNEVVQGICMWIVAMIGSASVVDPKTGDVPKHSDRYSGPVARGDGKLLVTALSADFAEDHDALGAQDPYIVTWLESADEPPNRRPRGVWYKEDGQPPRPTAATDPDSGGGVNPVWSEELEATMVLDMTPDLGGCTLFLEAWDDDPGRSTDFIGAARFEQLMDVVSGHLVDPDSNPLGAMFKVPMLDGDDALAGHLYCRVTFQSGEAHSSARRTAFDEHGGGSGGAATAHDSPPRTGNFSRGGSLLKVAARAASQSHRSMIAVRIRAKQDPEYIKKARAAVARLTPADLADFVAPEEPTDSVAVIAAAVCVLMGVPAGWKQARTAIAKPDFVTMFSRTHPDMLSDHMLTVVSKLVFDNNLDEVAEDHGTPRCERHLAMLVAALCPAL